MGLISEFSLKYQAIPITITARSRPGTKTWSPEHGLNVLQVFLCIGSMYTHIRALAWSILLFNFLKIWY